MTDVRFAEYKSRIEEELALRFSKRGFNFDGLLDAMTYSLQAGGKRIRPILVMAFCRAAGGAPETALPCAVAVEMLHTYTLIHDDLPCMDNDDLRRGKPTNHKVFGEGNAVLAGDAMQAEAFAEIIFSNLPDDRKVACLGALAAAAGVDGVCGGQYMDLNDIEGKDQLEFLSDLDIRKTGALITAACLMGVFAAGGGPEQQEAAMQYAAALGIAFQIRDDMLDVIGEDGTFGKPTGSDVAEGKTTFMSVYGAEECERMIEKLTESAMQALAVFPDPGFLPELTRELAGRLS